MKTNALHCLKPCTGQRAPYYGDYYSILPFGLSIRLRAAARPTIGD